jgi:ERCC4-type nuclease
MDWVLVSDDKLLVAPTEPPQLRAIGVTSLLPEDHGVDLLDMVSRVGIQRKTYADLHASLLDGRLAKQIEQIQHSQYLSHAVMLIESGTFGLDIPMSDQARLKLLLSIQGAGYSILHTTNVRDTAKQVPVIVEYFRSGEHTSVIKQPRISTNWQLGMLQMLPGVGIVTARRILSIVEEPIVLDEKIEEVVGSKKWAKIKSFIGSR